MKCLICYEKITNNDKFVVLSCKCSNSYHDHCINNWFKFEKSCPTCRYKWKSKKNNNKLKELEFKLFLESIGINSYNFNII